MQEPHSHLPGIWLTLITTLSSVAIWIVHWLPTTLQLLVSIASLILVVLKIREQILINQAKKRDLDEHK